MRVILIINVIVANSFAMSLWHTYDIVKDAYDYRDRSHYVSTNSNTVNAYVTRHKIVNYNFTPLKNNTELEKDIFKKLHCSEIISNQVINSCYSYKYKGALAVASVITKRTQAMKHIDIRPNWFVDNSIPRRFRGNSKDYNYSGYQRGHLASNWSYNYYWNIQKNVFNINANVVPQTPNLNEHVWIQAERFSRYEARKLGYVDVIDLVIYPKNPKRIGKDKIAVPSAFYKIIYNKSKHLKDCFYFKNSRDYNWRPHSLFKHKVSCSINFVN